MPSDPNVQWEPDAVREGPAGLLDRFIGPGATPAELLIQFVPAFVAGVAASLYPLLIGLPWSWVQITVAGLLALDMTGGVMTNATSPAKRWYHRKGQGFKQHLDFVAIHVLQLALVAWLFRGNDWLYAGMLYTYLMAGTVAILFSPLYLQRPVAMLLFIGAVIMDAYVYKPTPGLEWFVPVFFLKLFISHLLLEAPYTPMARKHQ